MTWQLYNDISQIRRKLVELVATDDLVTVEVGNKTWHTGNAVPLYSGNGDYRERVPWEYVEKVEEGTATGRGRAERMSAKNWIREWIQDHWKSMPPV